MDVNMEQKKYVLTDEKKEWCGRTLRRIRALRDFRDVKAGELGGWVETEKNLTQMGDAWVSDDARVSGNAWVSGDARVSDDARVSGDAWVYGDAWVSDDAQVSGDAQVYGDAWVYDDARVSGNAWVYGDARVYDDARVSGNAWVYGDAQVSGDARVYGNAQVSGDAWVCGNASIIWIGNIGSRADTTTFFACRDGKIGVKCGCFSGDIQQFEEAVRDTHGDSQYGKEYMAAIALAKAKIGGNDGADDR